MTRVREYQLPLFLQPSAQSFTFERYLWGEKISDGIAGAGNPPPLKIRILYVAINTLIALSVGLSAVLVDLLRWSSMTISIVYAYRIGFRNHLYNLISTLALPILLLAQPYGYYPQIDYKRPFTFNKNKILSLAVRNNDKKTVKSLLFPKDQSRTRGTSLLMHAAREQNKDLLAYLLSQGGNPNQKDKSLEMVPLCFSALAHDLEAVNLLLKNKADPNVGVISFAMDKSLPTTIIARLLLQHEGSFYSSGNKSPTLTADKQIQFWQKRKIIETEPYSIKEDVQAQLLKVVYALFQGGAVFKKQEIEQCLEQIKPLREAYLSNNEFVTEDEHKKLKERGTREVTNPYLAVFLDRLDTDALVYGLMDGIKEDLMYLDYLAKNLKKPLQKLYSKVQNQRTEIIDKALKGQMTYDNVPVNKDIPALIAEYWHGSLF